MRNILIFLFSSLLFTGVVFANTAQQNFSGFYTSAGLNFSNLQGKSQAHIDYYSSNGVDTYNDYPFQTTTKTVQSVGANLGFGYALVMHKLYFSVAAYANLSNMDLGKVEPFNYNVLTDDAAPFNVRVKHFSEGFTSQRQMAYGIKLTPGFVLNANNIFYVNLDVESATYHDKSGKSYNTKPQSGTPNAEHEVLAASSKTRSSVDYVFGLGILHAVNTHWSVYAELNSIDIPEAEVKRHETAGDDTLERDEIYKTSATGMMISTGVHYHF